MSLYLVKNFTFRFLANRYAKKWREKGRVVKVRHNGSDGFWTGGRYTVTVYR